MLKMFVYMIEKKKRQNLLLVPTNDSILWSKVWLSNAIRLKIGYVCSKVIHIHCAYTIARTHIFTKFWTIRILTFCVFIVFFFLCFCFEKKSRYKMFTYDIVLFTWDHIHTDSAEFAFSSSRCLTYLFIKSSEHLSRILIVVTIAQPWIHWMWSLIIFIQMLSELIYRYWIGVLH